VDGRMAAILIGCLAMATAAAGCGGAANGGPLTSQEQVRLLTDANLDLAATLDSRERELAALRAGGAKPAPVVRPPEDPFRPVDLRFGEFTGVLDAAAGPTSARLKIVLEPLDADGEIVKRAGSLELEAYEPAAAPQGQPISAASGTAASTKATPSGTQATPRLYHRWTFPQPELVQTWIGQLGLHGYVLKLPWPDGRPPAGATLILRAKMTMLSGEVLTAETTIEVPQPKSAPSAAKRP